MQVNAQDNDGNTPLHLAINVGAASLAESLLVAKAIVDLPNATGSTALALATESMCLEFLLPIVSQGTLQQGTDSLNTLNTCGDAPMHCAVLLRSKEALGLLVSKGATVDCQNAAGVSPLHVAINAVDTDIVQYLVGDCACTCALLLLIALWIDAVCVLCEWGAHVCSDQRFCCRRHFLITFIPYD